MVQQPQRPRRRLKGSLVWRAWLAVAVLMIAIAAVLLSRDVMRDWDRLQIDAERARRLAYSVRGVPLPGTPDLDDLAGRLAAHGVALGAPVFVRIFKREFEFELWLKRDDRFHRFAIYPICRWSGDLGPKLAQGDSQAPEGLLHRRSEGAQSEQPLAPLVQPGLPQRVRPCPQAHRKLSDGAWRLLVHRLLRHDGSSRRRDLARRDRCAQGRPAEISRPRVSVSHDGCEPVVAQPHASGCRFGTT